MWVGAVAEHWWWSAEVVLPGRQRPLDVGGVLPVAVQPVTTVLDRDGTHVHPRVLFGDPVGERAEPLLVRRGGLATLGPGRDVIGIADRAAGEEVSDHLCKRLVHLKGT